MTRRLSRRLIGVVAGAAMLAAPAATMHASASTPKAHVLLVCNSAKCPHTTASSPVFKSIAAAVGHATNGDWILVYPGVYKENVDVTAGHGLTSGLHIRGLNRNSVVLNGTGLAGSGVHVSGVNNTWVENMTAEHYRDGSGNGFYWTGVDGYWGRYLSAYDNGDYGIYAYDSTSSGDLPSVFAYVYGSWNADSGIYIGGCRDCHAVVTDSLAEKNAIGYSGTNAGGELYLINSEWRHNASGLVPNTLTSEPDPPQQGVNIVGNYIHDNNDTDVPGAGITAIAPVGAGIDIAGGWDNIIRDNLIVNEKHAGVLMHWLFTPPVNNQVVHNTFKHVAYAGAPGDADISLDGTSVQNCVDHNVDITSGKPVPATTDPMNIANLMDCGDTNPTRQNGRGIYGPGDPVVSIMTLLNAAGVTEAKKYSGPGPGPAALATMPNPCAGVPDNPWCSDGKLTVAVPTK